MGNWTYVRDEGEHESTPLIGKHRVVITNAEFGKTKDGTRDKITITVRPSGKTFTVKYYIISGEYWNRNLTDFYDAFPSIEEGNTEVLTWIGAEGAAMFGEDKTDSRYSRIRWFLKPDQAKDLPPFEGERPVQQTVTTLDDLEDVTDDGYDDLFS